MSAISDALRRASAAQSEGAAPPPLPVPEGGAPPMIAAAAPELLLPEDSNEGSDEESGKRFSPLLMVVFLLFAIGAGAGFYLWKGGGKTQRVLAKENSTAQIVAVAKKIEASNPAAAPAKVESNQPLRESVAATPTRQETAPVPPPAPAVKPSAPRIPVAFPPLRLQGIYYKPSNPSVVINGRTLYLNDEIQGVTVATIAPSSVTLVLSGQTNVLTLR